MCKFERTANLIKVGTQVWHTGLAQTWQRGQFDDKLIEATLFLEL
jgi:hypothetical protein